MERVFPDLNLTLSDFDSIGITSTVRLSLTLIV